MARDLKAKGKDVISLSIGEPDFDTPEFIRDAAKKALDDGYTHYTPVPGLMELRQAICKKLKRDNELTYDPSQIVVSNGAKQTIYNICQALINPGDEVIIFAPYWVSYEAIVKLAGGVPVVLGAGVETDFKVAASDLATAITPKTKFVLFSSPSNPTGSLYTQSELKDIADVLADQKHVFVVSDEIYEHIVFSGKHYSIAQNANIYDRTIVVNGMSKGYAMTGWRLGYMAGPKFLAAACNKIQGQVTSGATSFGQKAAAVALERDPKEVTQDMMQTFLKRRDMVLNELNKIEGMKLSIPQGAFYIFPDCKPISDSNDLAEALLLGANVATVAGAAFGAPNCIRISYAASEEVLMEACSRLQSFFSSLS
ncbi:UNVERIFIED_CONTAM: hypothetical protein GTU68_026967 [Idotea baltica]|nr:hypothetical protein [Idotea baltica]